MLAPHVTKMENWQKKLANRCDLPNSPKFFPLQSFLLYGIVVLPLRVRRYLWEDSYRRVLHCVRETGNSFDPLAVSVMKVCLILVSHGQTAFFFCMHGGPKTDR